MTVMSPSEYERVANLISASLEARDLANATPWWRPILRWRRRRTADSLFWASHMAAQAYMWEATR